MPNHDNDPLYNSVEDIFGHDEEPQEQHREAPRRSAQQPTQIENYDDDVEIDDDYVDDDYVGDDDDEPTRPQQVRVQRRPQKRIRFQDENAASHVSIIDYISGIAYMLLLMFVIIFVTNMKPVKNFIIKNIDGIEYESTAMNAITSGIAVGIIGTCMGVQYYKSSWA